MPADINFLNDMKKYILTIAAMAIGLAACTDSIDNYVPVVDDKAWKGDANKDLSIKPGDDFYMYCNGGYWKNTDLGNSFIKSAYWDPLEEHKEQRRNAMERTYWTKAMADVAKTDAATINLQKQKLQSALDRVNALTTKEEAWKLAAQLMKEGYYLPFKLHVFAANGKIGAAITKHTGNNVTDKPLNMQNMQWRLQNDADLMALLRPMKKATTRGIDGEKYEMLETMFQELGISLDLAYMPNISNKDMVAEDYEKAIADIETIQNKSLDELKDLFTKSIEQDAIFFDDEYLEKSLTTNFISYTHSGAVERYLVEQMGYAESYAYAKAYPFDKAQKQVYMDYVEQLRQTFRERINNNDWMSEASKQNAIEKLNGMTINIGEPDEWIEEGRGDISNEQTILDDMLAMRRSNLNLLLKLIGMPKDKAAFHMGLIQVPLSYVQAFYIRNLNAIYIYPEFMTPPAFDPQQNDAHNYATLAIAGHEMTHGYDVNGVKWDKDGNPSNILATEAEAKEFEKRSKQLIDYYSSLDIWPLSLGLKNDGAFTADENVADLGGFILAYNSYQKHLKKQGFEGEQLRLQQQRFYEAYAYVWCDKWSDVYALAITTDDMDKDNHSLPRERVNGVVTNTDDWYDLFDVTPANKFYVAPQSRVRIW